MTSVPCAARTLGRAVEGHERRVEVVAHVGEAREHLPRRQRVEFVEAVEEEHFASHDGSVAARALARQWQECHCAIDSSHASRDRPGAARRRRLRPLHPGAGLRQRAGPLRVQRVRARAPGGSPRRRASRSTSRTGSRRSPRPTPCSSPGFARRTGRRRRPCSTRCARPTRAARASPRSAPAPSSSPHAGLLDGRRATTHWAHAERLAERYPAVTVDPGVLYVDDGDVLTSAGVAAGIDLCLHLVRRDHGAEVANAVARRIVVAPAPRRRPGAVRRAPVPAAASAASRPRAPGRSSACASRSRWPRWRATPRAASAPSPAASAPRRARPRCAGCWASGSCMRAACWRPPTSPVEEVADARRLRHGRLAAHAFPARDGHHTGRVSPQLQG